MGCGCRKNKSTGTPKVTLTTQQQTAIREAAIKRANKTLANTKTRASLAQNMVVANERKVICEACPFSVFNSQTSDNKFKVCTKCQNPKPIFIICSDPSFSCPIGKFKALK